MALHGIYGGDAHAVRLQEDPRARIGADRVPGAPRPSGDTGLRLPQGGVRTPAAAYGEVPQGTDPDVWLGLSVEERAYFARLEAAGPLTYGPGDARDGVSLYRGRYINIKV